MEYQINIKTEKLKEMEIVAILPEKMKKKDKVMDRD